MINSQRSLLGMNRNEIGLVIAILVVIAITIGLDPQRNYWNSPADSVVNILRQATLLGIFALGSAVVIIAGGIDLSSGAVIAFSGTVCASFMLVLAPEEMRSPSTPLPMWVLVTAIAGTLFVGFLIGTMHAWLITVVGLPPFVATLASLVGLRSLARSIIPAVNGGLNQIQIFDARFRELSVWWAPGVLFVVLSLLLWVLMMRTVSGRHLYALGGNEQAARLSGIRTDRLKWLAYCISSVLASMAGIIYVSRQSVAEPTSLGLGYELNAIAAAVVGGCSLQGGWGTIPGVMLGCLFLRTLTDGIAKIIKSGADVYEGLIVGIVVVIAVAFSQVSATRGRKQFFPGLLGLASLLTLALTAGVLGYVVHKENRALAGGIAGITALVALSIVKLLDLRARGRAVAPLVSETL